MDDPVDPVELMNRYEIADRNRDIRLLAERIYLQVAHTTPSNPINLRLVVEGSLEKARVFYEIWDQVKVK